MQATLLDVRCFLPISLFRRLCENHRTFVMSLALPALSCSIAAAQAGAMTTISGTVYDARTSNALPLANVLVYATTSPIAPLPAGVQCMTAQAPTNVVSYATTEVDGTFTLGNIPVNASYTIVIQAGKWRRQFQNEAVGATPLTGLALNMPSNHTQGDIPMIAIVTGSVDAAECVLRDMGIADAEFTDDNQTVNPGGHIHLYQGGGSPGAYINTSTPMESALTGDQAMLDSYDMVMFPCQGGQYAQASGPLGNLVNYANAGGRLFTTHYSYVYLDPDAPVDAQFPPMANWTTDDEQQMNSGVGTVNTDFSDGATLAQWLQNSGATVAGSSNEIEMSTPRTDVSAVIAPTQSWLTLNGGSYAGQEGNPVMQMTFNTPVGAPAAGQCGRVMFNDYHVIAPTGTSRMYPSECPAETKMSAQEAMLEYALFDLSTFVKPVVPPTISLEFSSSPMVVKPGDTGDQVTVTVTNTSTTTPVGDSAILTIALPQLMTATAITDSTGGWLCTLSTLTCTRNTSLAASTSDAVTLTLSVADYPAGGLTNDAAQITATVSSANFSANATGSGSVIFQQTPAVSWPAPAPIVYGAQLGAAQLNATSPVAGTFTYSPSAGTVLNAGQQTLNVTFTPNDTVDYVSTTATVTLNVHPATPPVTLTSSVNPAFLTYGVSFIASLPSYASTQTGTMTFYDGSTQIGTASISAGTATFTTTVLAAGPHSVTAVYSGDGNYATGTSGAVAENIEDFSLTFAEDGNGMATASAGGQATYKLMIAPVNGTTLPADVTLEANAIPMGMTAVISPATVNAGSGATNVTLTIALPSNAANEIPGGLPGKGAAPATLGLLLLPLAGRLRKGRARLAKLMVVLLATAALAAGLTSCSGTSLSSQSFSFTVSAASGALTHSVTPELTVQ